MPTARPSRLVTDSVRRSIVGIVLVCSRAIGAQASDVPDAHGEQLGQGRALVRGHVRDGFIEVRLVLSACVLGFEQQDQLWREVWNGIFGVVK
jgi:hypothetical protein